MSDVNLTVQEGSDVYLSLTETPAVVSVTNPLVAAASFSVTVGTSVTVSNFPATQGISGTVAITEIGNININDGSDNLAIGVQSFRGQDPAEWLKASGGNVPISGSVTVKGNLIGSGPEETGSLLLAIDDLGFQNPVLANGDGHLLVSVQSGTVTANLSSANLNSVTVGVRGSVTVANFPATQVVSVSNFPSSSSVTIANFPATQVVSVSNFPASSSVTIANFPAVTTVAGTVALDSASLAALESVTVTIGAAVSISNFPTTQVVSVSNFPVSSSVTIGGFSTSSLPPSTVTVGNTVTISGTVTAGNIPVFAEPTADYPCVRIGGVGVDGFVPVQIKDSDGYGILFNNGNLPISGTVTIGSLPAISGTVTVGNTVTISALPSGALTTRFGSVTTANTAQITSAVTNTSRKYLLAQNISAGTVTIGIGFSPTTTQGIQLTAGGGLTFDAFCPTGAVYWLGAVTGAAFTILEG